MEDGMAISERWKYTKPLTLPTSDMIDIAKDLFSSHPKIEIGYLFGSRLQENAKPHADIDIAFHSTKDFRWEDYYLLMGDFSKAFHSDRFDLLWLDKASPDIVFDVIKFGRVIFYRDADMLNDFELYAKKRFWDYKIYLHKRRNIR